MMDSTRSRFFEKLIWLIPILVASGIFLTIFLNPAAIKDRLFFPVVVLFGMIAPLGGFWGIYQSIRNEKHPGKYIAIVMFVPFGFLWYYFERYRKSEGYTPDQL
jgi:hypothetical protein